MNRWNLRVSLLLTFLFTAVLLLFRAHPYDEHQNRQPFTQDVCTAACFVGIQPGVTTVDEAVTRLEASGWTREIDNRTINNVSGYISWKWSDQKPDWINGTIEGEIWATQKHVVQIMIYGNLQLGDTRLVLGSPDQEIIDRAADPEKGKLVYEQNCARCHGKDGQGQFVTDVLKDESKQQGGTATTDDLYYYPPLWGEHSFNGVATLYRFTPCRAPSGVGCGRCSITTRPAAKSSARCRR